VWLSSAYVYVAPIVTRRKILGHYYGLVAWSLAVLSLSSVVAWTRSCHIHRACWQVESSAWRNESLGLHHQDLLLTAFSSPEETRTGSKHRKFPPGKALNWRSSYSCVERHSLLPLALSALTRHSAVHLKMSKSSMEHRYHEPRPYKPVQILRVCTVYNV